MHTNPQTKGHFYFYTFTAFSPKQIYISKVLVCNLLSFCETFRLMYHSLRSDNNGRFSILRLYIVVVFARSLVRFATTCTAVHSDMLFSEGDGNGHYMYIKNISRLIHLFMFISFKKLNRYIC